MNLSINDFLSSKSVEGLSLGDRKTQILAALGAPPLFALGRKSTPEIWRYEIVEFYIGKEDEIVFIFIELSQISTHGFPADSSYEECSLNKSHLIELLHAKNIPFQIKGNTIEASNGVRATLDDEARVTSVSAGSLRALCA